MILYFYEYLDDKYLYKYIKFNYFKNSYLKPDGQRLYYVNLSRWRKKNFS
jgi:hypothetical protein